MPNKDLTVNELLMLLALDDENGKVRWQASPYLDYALAGGLLSELAARNLIRMDGEAVAAVQPSAETGSPLMNDVLHRIATSPDRITLSGWVSAIVGLEGLAERQMEELVAKGVLEHHEDNFLWIFHRTRYPARDMTPEKQIVAQIREAVLGEGPVEPRLSVLITLAHGAHLLRGPLTAEELEARRGRLDQIARGQAIGEAACQLIKEAERALFVASSIPFMGVPQL